MKVRLENNSLRLRLTKSEVEQFHDTHRLTGSTIFGSLPDNRLQYILMTDGSINKIECTFEKQTICIKIPSGLTMTWATSDLISLEENLTITNNYILNVIVEKDFKRLSKRHPKDPDAYPNPMAKV